MFGGLWFGESWVDSRYKMFRLPFSKLVILIGNLQKIKSTTKCKYLVISYKKLINIIFCRTQTSKPLVTVMLTDSRAKILDLEQYIKKTLKLQPHEGDNLDERIITISSKRVYGATQARPCETSCCLLLRCTVKVSNKTRLFRSHERLRCPAKKNSPSCRWPTLQTLTISVGLPTCREWTGKRSLVTRNQPNS